jgi:hypothetical protein
MTLQTIIQDYLSTCREINQFCTQNGWIDGSTITFKILEHNQNAVTISVEFIEIIMGGAGCVENRVSCFGHLKLLLDTQGGVESSCVI